MRGQSPNQHLQARHQSRSAVPDPSFILEILSHWAAYSRDQIIPNLSFSKRTDELCILLIYYLVFSFDPCAFIVIFEGSLREIVWIITGLLMSRKVVSEGSSVAREIGHLAVISWSPTMKWPKNSTVTAGVNIKKEDCPQLTTALSCSVSLPLTLSLV